MKPRPLSPFVGDLVLLLVLGLIVAACGGCASAPVVPDPQVFPAPGPIGAGDASAFPLPK